MKRVNNSIDPILEQEDYGDYQVKKAKKPLPFPFL
jgi:hypothetical protein